MKNQMQRLVLTVLTMGLLVGFGTTARAGSITQTFNFAMAYMDWTNSIGLAKVDLVGGTLTDVKIKVTTDWQSQISVTNEGASATSVKARTEMQMGLDGGSTILGTETTQPFLDVFAGPNSYFSVQSDASTNFTVVSTNHYNYTYDSGSYDLSEFVGTGILPMISVGTDAASSLNVNSGGPAVEIESSEANLQFQVVYDYNTGVLLIPEPSTGVLFGLGGVIGLACWGWQRRIRQRN